jgi:hypothetical protein
MEWSSLAAAALAPLVPLALLVAGCSSEPTTVVVQTGAVIVDWTIRGDKAVDDCTSTGATTLHVTLTSSQGTSNYVQDCAAFATTISGLLPDTYAGTVQLLDSTGAARTTAVALQPFAVYGGTTATVLVDFPSNSFY